MRLTVTGWLRAVVRKALNRREQRKRRGSSDERLFALLQPPRCVCKDGVNILWFQIRIRLQDSLACLSGCEQLQDRAGGDAQAPDTGLAPHHGWVVGNAIDVHRILSGLNAARHSDSIAAGAVPVLETHIKTAPGLARCEKPLL